MRIYDALVLGAENAASFDVLSCSMPLTWLSFAYLLTRLTERVYRSAVTQMLPQACFYAGSKCKQLMLNMYKADAGITCNKVAISWSQSVGQQQAD